MAWVAVLLVIMLCISNAHIKAHNGHLPREAGPGTQAGQMREEMSFPPTTQELPAPCGPPLQRVVRGHNSLIVCAYMQSLWLVAIKPPLSSLQ